MSRSAIAICAALLGFLVGALVPVAIGHAPCEFEPECEYIQVPNPYTAEMETVLVCNE